MFLTIGMACYNDYNGVVFSVQSLLMHHDMADCEVIVVDSNPASPDGEATANYCNKLQHRNVRYIPTERRGTTQPRQQVFDEARGKFVMVMDCHVLLTLPALARLRHWYMSNPTTNDICSGPMMLESGGFHTHFNEQWRSAMYGTWGQAWRHQCGQPVSYIQLEDRAVPHTLSSPQKRLTHCPRCSVELPIPAWAGHEQTLLSWQFQPLGFSDSDNPFEIPGMGLGLFTCRKEAWPGFNPHFSGFGGEELYIHEKFRQRGGKAYCLPFLKWWHRFGRPGGIPYRADMTDRVRNYVLGFTELGLDLKPVHDHFVSTWPNPFESEDVTDDMLYQHLQYVHGFAPELLRGKNRSGLVGLHASTKISQTEWDRLVADPVGYSPQKTPATMQHNPNQPSATSSLDEIFEWCKSTPRDLDQHLEKLKELASKCDHVTEITKRRESTIGLMAGRPTVMVTYTLEPDIVHERIRQIVASTQRITGGLGHSRATHEWTYNTRFNPTNPGIHQTDLLFIDEIHHGDRLKAQLEACGPKVNRYLVIRGTGGCGLRSEDGTGPGLFHGIQWWLANNQDWFCCYHTDTEYGLTVLSKHPDDKPAQEIRPWPKGFGPGTELKAILSDLGINPSAACDCNARAFQMDEWGVEGCLEHRNLIIEWLRLGQDRWGWTSKFSAGLRGVFTGLAFQLNWSDPIPSLVDLAIKRANEKLPQCKRTEL